MILKREMQKLDKKDWPVRLDLEAITLDIWQSKDYLACLVQNRADGLMRLTVNSIRKNNRGQFRDGITWDELQRVKNETLGPDIWCVEVYPDEAEAVRDVNQRHLWVVGGNCKYKFPKKSALSIQELKSIRFATNKK